MSMLILNGKKAGISEIRAAVTSLRKSGHIIQVRSTWEHGDVERFIAEAVNLCITRIIAGGGDGTVNEVADVIAKLNPADRPEIAILPLGTANDFATACGIPNDIEVALTLAVTGKPHEIDLVSANERYFINVASAGFGAQVTMETPVELKNLFGGNAYLLSGLVQALNFKAYEGVIRAKGADGVSFTLEGTGLVGAICNGRMAGGGQPLAPNATINDGLLDILFIREFPASDISQVIEELLNPLQNSTYVHRFQATAVDIESTTPLPVNLDGEPTSNTYHRFKILPNAAKLVLPDDSSILRQS